MRMTRSDIDAFPRFCAIPPGYFTVDSLCFFSGNNVEYLLSVLNSDYAAYYFFNNVATLDNGGFQMRQQYVENIPIPPETSMGNPMLTFGFTDSEIEYINEYIKMRKQEILKSDDEQQINS